MKKIIFLLILLVIIVTISGCVNESQNFSGDNTQIQYKDCGSSSVYGDDGSVCFRDEYDNCRPVKVNIPFYNATYVINGGTRDSCNIEFIASDFTYPNGDKVNGKITCTYSIITVISGTQAFYNMVAEAAKYHKCSGDPEVLAIFGIPSES